MIYKKATLTVEDITKLFLYGTLETPSDLQSESLIRPTYAQMTEEQRVTVEIDPAAYMATARVGRNSLRIAPYEIFHFRRITLH